jgi:hypothetical protein
MSTFRPYLIFAVSPFSEVDCGSQRIDSVTQANPVSQLHTATPLTERLRHGNTGAVRKSTFLPPNNWDSSSSILAIVRRLGLAPGSNSTSKSMSLSDRSMPFSADPNSESRRMQ